MDITKVKTHHWMMYFVCVSQRQTLLATMVLADALGYRVGAIMLIQQEDEDGS